MVNPMRIGARAAVVLGVVITIMLLTLDYLILAPELSVEFKTEFAIIAVLASIAPSLLSGAIVGARSPRLTNLRMTLELVMISVSVAAIEVSIGTQVATAVQVGPSSLTPLQLIGLVWAGTVYVPILAIATGIPLAVILILPAAAWAKVMRHVLTSSSAMDVERPTSGRGIVGR